MILNNYMLACRLGTIKDIGGSNRTAGQTTLIVSNTAGGYYGLSNAGGWVDVGYDDGTNYPLAADNYKLGDSNSYGGTQVGALTWVSTAFVNTNPYLKCYTTVYRNDGSDDVTVKELGILGKNGTTGNYNSTFLVARKILATPVVVPAGATVAFTYGIKV